MAAKPPQVTVSRPSDTTKGLCDRPLETFAHPFPEISWFPALAGRGGSVSRRDHNHLAENRASPPDPLSRRADGVRGAPFLLLGSA